MSKELDSIKRDIDAALGQGGFVVYHGLPRDDEHLSPIRWDAVNHPDPALFLKAAAELGVRLIVSSERTFSEEMLSDAQSQLETAAVPREERREMERSVRRFEGYVGFTCSIQLSFDHGRNMYLYQVLTPWYEEFLDLLDELDEFEEPESFGDEDDNPLGSYYSQN